MSYSRNRPPPSYESGRSSMGEKMPPRPRAFQLRPAKAPDNAYIFSNLVAVSPLDIPPSRDGSDIHLLINGQYVFSARPFQGFPQGQISLSDAQRTFTQIALTDIVNVEYYDHFREGGGSFISEMDVFIGFAGRKTRTAEYDQADLTRNVVRTFQGQILAPGQQFIMDHESIPLRLAVKTVDLANLSMNQDPSKAVKSSDPRAKGILTEQTVITFFKDAKSEINIKASMKRANANAIIQPDFNFEDMGIGGLSKEFSVIFRRAFASRIFPPGFVSMLGVEHVKGMLLHGPPGTGKTLIARQIGKMLNAREPKVVNGPEVLNKYVGQSEENIRKLFEDAEKEYKEKKEESGLHIIIFDELDAVCKQRGSGAGGGTGVGDSVVNQLLSKLDGVDQLNNILLIGMTNRMDLIDDALLRPGRLEVHIEISLPDESGRLEILGIHTAKMRANNLLGSDVVLPEFASLTKNYSGAEISGLVKSASSFAFMRHNKVGSMGSIKSDISELQVGRDDFMHALEEVQPAFGSRDEELQGYLAGGMIPYSQNIDSILHEGSLYVDQVQRSTRTNVLSCLIHGPPGSGKTALAAEIARRSNVPFIRFVTPMNMKGFNEASKVQYLTKVFMDAHKSTMSLLIIDNIETMIDWSPIGPRFSNSVVVALNVMIRESPPKGKKLVVLATTSKLETLAQLDFDGAFNVKIPVPSIRNLDELANVLELEGSFRKEDIPKTLQMIAERTGAASQGYGLDLGIKDVLVKIETATIQADDPALHFAESIADSVLPR